MAREENSPWLDVVHAAVLLDRLLLAFALEPSLVGLAKRLRAKPKLLDVLECLPIRVHLVLVRAWITRRGLLFLLALLLLVLLGRGSLVGLTRLPSLAFAYPLADGGVYGRVDNGLIEIDDKGEFAGRVEVLCGVALDALCLLEGDGRAVAVVGHGDCGAAVVHLAAKVIRPAGERRHKRIYEEGAAGGAARERA